VDEPYITLGTNDSQIMGEVGVKDFGLTWVFLALLEICQRSTIDDPIGLNRIQCRQEGILVKEIRPADRERRRLQLAPVHTKDFMLAHGFHGEIDSE
jgi:hypothetical protein